MIGAMINVNTTMATTGFTQFNSETAAAQTRKNAVANSAEI
jgi:hypothetical protein